LVCRSATVPDNRAKFVIVAEAGRGGMDDRDRDSVGLLGELPVLLGHAGNHVSIVFWMMSLQELIAQAQQGQPEAIAQLINQSLKAKGIQATVNWSGGTLQVMLMLNANVSYTEAKLLSIIRRGLTALQSPRIQQVTVYAKSATEPVPLWSRQLDLMPASPSPEPAIVDTVVEHPIPPRRSHLDGNAYRVSGELAILIGSIMVTVLLTLPLLKINLLVFIVGVLLIGLMVKVQQSQFLGSAVKIHPQQFPEIYQAAQTAANRLAMPLPDVFLVQSPVINAFATGFYGRKKTVVLHSALVEAMGWDELVYILGHEFSHIKCYHTSFSVLTNSVENIVRIPILSQIMGFIFLFWSRKCEYTCDRGGLIANQNLEAAVTALAKLAVGRHLFGKMDIPALMTQKTDIDRNGLSKLAEVLETHPYIINRIHALKSFYQSAQYRRLA
jgi:Zn-dependent protease with chaperone function